MDKSRDDLVIFAITRKGVEKAVSLHSTMGGDLFLPNKFREEGPQEAVYFTKSAAELMEDFFSKYQKIVGFCALGAMVRLIAPHLKSKTEDPAVVALDEGGRFAISVVSGHLGGANDLAEEVANVVGAIPVITTASDVSGLLAVDLLGKPFGWKLEKGGNMTRVSAAVVNGETVAMVQTCGEESWRENFQPLPPNLHLFSSLDEAEILKPSALILITDHLLDENQLEPWADKTVIYRPKSLVAGAGCNSGTPAEEVETVILGALKKNGLAIGSLRNLATVEKKRGEPALEAFAQKFRVPIVYYEADELNQVKEIPNPSPKAMEHVGARGVAEPAAMLSAGNDSLLQEKIISGNVTIALARVNIQKEN